MNVEGDIHIHSYPTSPTGQAVTPLDYHPGRYGLTRTARSRTPTNRRIRKSAEQTGPASGASTEQFSSSTSSNAEQSGIAAASSTQPQAAQDTATTARQDHEALPHLPQKRTFEAMLMEQHDSIEPPHHTWDSSPPTRYYEDMHCAQFAAAAARQLQAEGHAVLFTDLAQAPPESDDSSGPDDDTDPATRLQTRKEAKALEREVPWRSILKLPPKDIEAYIQSNQKEERGWMNWGSVQAVPDDEAAAIMSNPARRKRVLRSRACYRNKSKIPDQLQAKTRVVALGHLDPDLRRISQDSPMPMRISEYILLSIYIAGANHLMENDPVPWLLWAGDVSTAFMQGSFEIEERPEPLCLLPPRDEITLRAGTFKAKLYSCSRTYTASQVHQGRGSKKW